MRLYKTAITKPIPSDARYSTRKDGQYVTFDMNGSKVTGKVTTKGTVRIEAPHYSLKFKNNQNVLCYMRAYDTYKDSYDLGETIKRLMLPGADISITENLPERIRQKLIEFEIIDTRQASGKSIRESINEYIEWMRKTRVGRHGLQRCEDYCKATLNMLNKIVDDCQFYEWSDISKAEFEKYLGSMNIKTRTYNNHVISFKSFCKWAVENNRTTKNNVAFCKCITGEDTEKRRPLNPEEFSHLLAVTREAPTRFCMTGEERAVMYLLAAETGLRKNELLSLRVSSFDLDKGIVTLEKEFTKNRHRAEIPLKRERINQFRLFLSKKLPNVSIFPVTKNLRAADMVAKDLKEAGFQVETDNGKCVFHCLRNTYSTNINRTNATWIEQKMLMRHSLKGDVTARYTEVTMDRKREITEQLPAFEWPMQVQELKKVAG